MSKNELTKAQARTLISPVVDNEASEEERRAFMDYIAHHEDIRREYESIKKLKTLISSRCPCAKAPLSLMEYVKTVRQRHQSESDPIYDIPCDISVSDHKHSQTPPGNPSTSGRFWMLSVAATILVFAAVWGFFNFYGSSETPVYEIEQYAYEHFIQNNGRLVPPTISTASLGFAEIQLARNHDIRMTIPALKNAEFKGIMYGDFVPNYKAPMLEYYLPAQDQFIYIFAFELDKMKEFGKLIRDSKAIKKCNKPKDFYIRNVKGKHVVSWKWDNVWYAAISNHDGNTLASLVEPLQYNPSTPKK